MNHYKLTKYNTKLSLETDKNKINKYTKKINYYRLNMAAGSNINLSQPHQPKNESEYNTEPNIKADKINAHGYGLLQRHKKLEPVVFERRSPYPNDVVVRIMYCGVCHSDWHYITGEWEANLPLVCGHEFTGRIVAIGSHVTKFKIGDAVAIGTQINSCRICKMCINGHEQYCENGLSSTYDGRDRRPNEINTNSQPSGEQTHGGYSNIITVTQDFVFHLPDNLPLDVAAPLLCAGITTYSPLKQAGVKPGFRVGVAGIGGLGHIAVKIAKAMGAYVVAITSTEWKLDDVSRIGADQSVLVTDRKTMNALSESLDVIIDTIPKYHDLNIYLDLLAYNGILWILGPFTPLNFDMSLLASKNRSIRSSIVGGISETIEMLNFCAKHNIVADIEKIPLSHINKTYNKLIKSQVKYRFVLDINH